MYVSYKTRDTFFTINEIQYRDIIAGDETK